MMLAPGPRRIDGYAALEHGGPLVPWSFDRRAPRTSDVVVEILFCGICHSDVHAVRGGWTSEFPVVPGHEIVGRVIETGSGVTRFAVDDIVAVGTVVDSCRLCEPCIREMESYCYAYPVTTYGGTDRIDGSRTRGGYSETYVADERYVYHVPAGIDLAGVAPLLCAGITTYSPLKHWGVGPGKTVGVLGVGGLGHLGIKFARAFGAEVVAFTTSPDKVEDALALGAHEVVLSSDHAALEAQSHRFDFILDTISSAYQMNPFIRALKLDGVLCTLGLRGDLDLRPVNLAMGRRSLVSSGTGGTKEAAEMLAFCAEHGIVADVEVVGPTDIDACFDRLERNAVKYRFVIDMKRR